MRYRNLRLALVLSAMGRDLAMYVGMRERKS